MRGRMVLAAIGLSLVSCHADAPPVTPSAAPAAPEAAAPTGMRAVNWCERSFPWADGPVSAVALRECAATYQEARSDDPSDLASWSWRLDGVVHADDETAVVTLRMTQDLPSRTALFTRTYWFRWDGHDAVLEGAGDIVMVNQADRF